MELEKFPVSKSANNMLDYVTHGWYDKSYVGKWIFEAIGRNYDDLENFIVELPYQRFVKTATWGLMYWEELYGLQIREDLSYEERRERINERRYSYHPINPKWLGQYLSKLTGRDVEIIETPRTYTFKVSIADGPGSVNLNNVMKQIDVAKPAHLAYSIILNMIENIDLKAGFSTSSQMKKGFLAYAEDHTIPMVYQVKEKVSISLSPGELGNIVGYDFLVDEAGRILCDESGELLYIS